MVKISHAVDGKMSWDGAETHCHEDIRGCGRFNLRLRRKTGISFLNFKIIVKGKDCISHFRVWSFQTIHQRLIIVDRVVTGGTNNRFFHRGQRVLPVMETASFSTIGPGGYELIKMEVWERNGISECTRACTHFFPPLLFWTTQAPRALVTPWQVCDPVFGVRPQIRAKVGRKERGGGGGGLRTEGQLMDTVAAAASPLWECDNFGCGDRVSVWAGDDPETSWRFSSQSCCPPISVAPCFSVSHWLTKKCTVMRGGTLSLCSFASPALSFPPTISA